MKTLVRPTLATLAIIIGIACTDDAATFLGPAANLDKSDIDGKPLNLEKMRSLREDPACGFSIPGPPGYRRAIVVRKRELPFVLPEAKDRSVRGQYRSITALIPHDDEGDNLIAQCWVPVGMSAPELVTMLRPSSGLQRIYRRLERASLVPDSLFVEPRSREYQQLKYERLADNPSPLPLTKASIGANLNVECTTVGWPTDPGGQWLICMDCYTSIVSMPGGETRTVHCTVTYSGRTYSVSFPGDDATNWWIDPSWLVTSVYPDEEALTVAITPEGSTGVPVGAFATFNAVTNGTPQRWEFTSISGTSNVCLNDDVCTFLVRSDGNLTLYASPQGTFSPLQPSTSVSIYVMEECYEPTASQYATAWTPGDTGTFDKSVFASYLRTHVFDPAIKPFGSGKCATKVRQALCAAGILGGCDDPHGLVRPECAKDWGPYLEKMKFSRIRDASATHEGYVPLVGDIAVFDYAPAGHVAAWDGSNWVSDFVQSSVQPCTSCKPPKPYSVYRRP